MQGIQQMLADDLFLLLEGSTSNGCNTDNTTIMISFFELYGGFIQDLLNDRQRLKILEDGKGEINVTGLKEMEVKSAEQFLDLVQIGNLERTTHTTEANDTSSRSHAICQIMLRDRSTEKLRGKLSLVDLAGSERGSDTKSHNAQRRTESAEINTSLLALKECIRALADKKGHVPYRASKLTLLLKDCFTCESAMTTMIATISPGASAADHSLNTLRYADRTKDKSGKKSPMRPSYREASLPRKESSDAKTKEVVLNGNDTTSKLQRSAQDEAIRKGYLEFFEQEENTLNAHIGKIRNFAELLEEEGVLLAQIQKTHRNSINVDEYATALEDILNKKEFMIMHLRDQISLYKDSLKKQQELSKAAKRGK
jgi:kinesin family protein 2/24